ncbi:uncharacterized protein LOC111694742 [Eurytemora carolleeae]|uniref:uncharacterized protein LOC111694742 n=1 Tax=Eurytemora carolleeae TaxID=1294199 RepID=UPI000C76D709|nr:uncharacterized protein LOC111694742 [Eurytemora carolleeae]|eukprot:XP_023319512.1 uncharacterized protein LOC111694742 [Eurytemora affinis]
MCSIVEVLLWFGIVLVMVQNLEQETLLKLSNDFRVNEGKGSRNSLAELMVRFGQKSRVNPDLEKDSWTPSCNVTDLNPDAQDALRRVKSVECTREITEISCNLPKIKLFPDNIQRTNADCCILQKICRGSDEYLAAFKFRSSDAKMSSR